MAVATHVMASVQDLVIIGELLTLYSLLKAWVQVFTFSIAESKEE